MLYWTIRAHLHQRIAGLPAGAVSVFCAGRVFTLVRVRKQFHFAEAPFRGAGSLIYKYWPISAPYSWGSHRRIAPSAIPVGARSEPAAEEQRTSGCVNSTTQFLQTFRFLHCLEMYTRKLVTHRCHRSSIKNPANLYGRSVTGARPSANLKWNKNRHMVHPVAIL